MSNTNMHLMVGPGRKARVLVPYPPEWPWMETGDESPWFPGFRVYRQLLSRSWDDALARLRTDLLAAGRDDAAVSGAGSFVGNGGADGGRHP